MTKKVNYTDKDLAIMREVYVPMDSVENRKKQVAELVKTLDRKPASIVAKLSNMKLYVPATKTSKITDGEPETKESLVARLSEMMGVPVFKMDSIVKANKKPILMIMAHITQLHNELDDLHGVEESEQDESADILDSDTLALQDEIKLEATG